MPRLAVAVVASLALAGCAAKPTPPRLQREHVTKHYLVVVQEQDPTAPEEERESALVTRPIAGGPLGAATEHEKAFASYDPRFTAFVTWTGECLDVTVARRGFAPFDDFDAHGCVKPEGRTTTIASVKGAHGNPIDVLVWVFEAG